MASIIKVLSTVAGKSKSSASSTATAGMTTNIASSDRASRPGRRIRYDRSRVVVFRPKPKTVHSTLTCKARTSK